MQPVSPKTQVYKPVVCHCRAAHTVRVLGSASGQAFPLASSPCHQTPISIITSDTTINCLPESNIPLPNVSHTPRQEGENHSRMAGSPRRQFQQCWLAAPRCRAPPALHPGAWKPECGTRAYQRKQQRLPSIRDTHVIGAQPSTLQMGLGQLPQRTIPILAARFAKNAGGHTVRVTVRLLPQTESWVLLLVRRSYRHHQPPRKLQSLALPQFNWAHHFSVFRPKFDGFVPSTGKSAYILIKR